MNKQELISQIFQKKSFLCVGLDTDVEKIPAHLQASDDPIFDFNKAIIDATAPFCVAYKPNLAFYECYGLKGLQAFERTIDYLKVHYPKHFVIADAKRGDIGNTSTRYAKTFFETYAVDALTVAAYVISCRTAHLFVEGENRFLAATQCFAEPVEIPRFTAGGIDVEEVTGDLWVGFGCKQV